MKLANTAFDVDCREGAACRSSCYVSRGEADLRSVCRPVRAHLLLESKYVYRSNESSGEYVSAAERYCSARSNTFLRKRATKLASFTRTLSAKFLAFDRRVCHWRNMSDHSCESEMLERSPSMDWYEGDDPGLRPVYAGRHRRACPWGKACGRHVAAVLVEC